MGSGLQLIPPRIWQFFQSKLTFLVLFLRVTFHGNLHSKFRPIPVIINNLQNSLIHKQLKCKEVRIKVVAHRATVRTLKLEIFLSFLFRHVVTSAFLADTEGKSSGLARIL